MRFVVFGSTICVAPARYTARETQSNDAIDILGSCSMLEAVATTSISPANAGDPVRV